MDAFDPYLLDIALDRANNMERYVGNAPTQILDNLPEGDEPEDASKSMLKIFGGEERIGPAAGCMIIVIQVYPFVSSPTQLIVVGKSRVDSAARFAVHTGQAPHEPGRLG